MGPPSGSSRELCEKLAEGLHAMAQPLTILRCALGALTQAKAVASEHSRYLDTSTTQVERVCEMLSSTRGLLDAALSEPECVTLHLWDLIEPIMAEQFGSLRIEAIRPQEAICAWADYGRTEQALRTALNVAAKLSPKNSVVQLKLLPCGSFVDLVIEACDGGMERLDSTDRLSLMLAEVNIQSQMGTVEYKDNPFWMLLRLPTQAPHEQSAGIGSLVLRCNKPNCRCSDFIDVFFARPWFSGFLLSWRRSLNGFNGCSG